MANFCNIVLRISLTTMVTASLTAGGLAISPPASADDGNVPLPQVTPQTRAIELVRPSIVSIQTNWRAWVDVGAITRRGTNTDYRKEEWTSSCTGVVVGSAGYIATAGHCVDPGPSGAQRHAREMVVNEAIEKGMPDDVGEQLLAAVQSGRIRMPVEGSNAGTEPERTVRVRFDAGEVNREEDTGSVTARVLEVRSSDDGDVAVMKVEESNLPVAALASPGYAQAGQEVLAMGYPFDRGTNRSTLTTRNGQINSLAVSGMSNAGQSFDEISATLSEGMSGGPTIGLDGHVIGIASFVLREGKGNYIVPSTVIGEALAHNGVDNRLGPLDVAYRAGLDNFYRGHTTAAIAQFDRVLQLMPEHRLAAIKRGDASRWQQLHPEVTVASQGRVPDGPRTVAWPLMILAVAAAVLALAGSAVFWKRRRLSAGAVDRGVDAADTLRIPLQYRQSPQGMAHENHGTAGWPGPPAAPGNFAPAGPFSAPGRPPQPGPRDREDGESR